jgi:putative FmdB family regulatory protein
MPIYDFYCNDCKKDFTQLFSVKEYEKNAKDGFRCPQCNKANVERVITSLHVIAPKKS